MQACLEIINQITGLSPDRGKPFVKKTPYPVHHVISIIGITGDIQGQVIFSYSDKAAQRLASAMAGMEITAIDDMTLSALGELSNMVMGRSGTLLSEAGINVTITPPTTLTGEQVTVTNQKPVICVPYYLENDQLEINFAIKGVN
ncbi:MAG: chemotaxis protein CheX [Peptococcaceae bacterium]|nr:chemotaxis protein CheX [Peptococcaceae bacterium]